MKFRSLFVPLNGRRAIAPLPSCLFVRLHDAFRDMKAGVRDLPLLPLGVLLVAATGTVQAATITKSDTATMNTAADWSGTAPASAHIGTFDGTVSAPNAAALTLGGNVSLRGLVFSSSLLGPVSVATGSTLTLGGVGIDMSAANQDVTFGNAMTLGETQTWNVAASRTLTVGGIIGGSGSNFLTVAGGGNVVLTGANTFSGGINLTGGTLSIGSGAIITATAGTGRIYMSNGTTMRINTTTGSGVSNAITISGASANATITSALLSNSYSGNITGSSDQTFTIGDGNVSFGAATPQLAGFPGTVSIGVGKLLRFSMNSATADVGGVNTTFAVNGTISARNGFAGVHLGALSGSGALNGGGSTPTGTSTWVVGEKNTDSAFEGTINNGTSSPSALTKLGTGMLTLDGSAAHGYTGATNANRGTLLLDFANLVTPTNLLSSGSTLGLGGGTFSIKGQASGTTDQTFASTNINGGASAIVLNPNGGTATNLNLTGIARTVGGGTVNYTPVAGGAVNTTTANAFPTGGQQTILGGYATVSGNTWAVSGTGATPGAITGLATGSYTNTAATALSAAGALDVDVAAAGTNTSGALTVNSLRFDDSTAPTAVNLTGLLTVATGGILVTPNVGANPITISGGSLTSFGTTTANDLVVIQNNTAAPLTISSAITGTNKGFTKSGAGTVIVTGTNTIAGAGVFVNEGTLQLGDGTAATVIGGASNSMNLTGGTLSLNLLSGGTYTTGAINISATSGLRLGTGNITVGSSSTVGQYVSVPAQSPVTLNLSSAGGQLTHAGTESGFTGTIAMTGATAFTYRFNNTSNNNTGSTTALYDLGTNANIMTSRNGGLATTLTISLGGLQGGAATTLRGAGSDSGVGGTNAMTFSIGALNTSTTFNGKITNGTITGPNGGLGTTAITKVGSGTLTLSGANTNTGIMTVTTGILNFAKQASLYNTTPASWIPANLPVASGATLAVGVGDSASGYFDSTALDTLLDATHLGASTATTGLKTGAFFGMDTTNATAGAFTYGTAIIDHADASALNLAKVGTGILNLTGVNTYTGNTTVNTGTLHLAGTGSLRFKIGANGVNNKISGVIQSTGAGILSLDGAFNIDLSGADVTVGNAWKIVSADLLPTTTFSPSFSVPGFTESANVWTKPDGANLWTFSEATGLLTYTVAAVPTGSYTTWATANGITGEPASGDYDKDGLTNLMEYALGKDPKVSSTPAGTYNGSSVSFTKGADAIANSDVSWVIQKSTDLGITDPWIPVVSQPAGDATATISYTLPSGLPKVFVRLVVVK